MRTILCGWLLALGAACCAPAWSQNVISDDFTQAVSTNSWYFFNGACMTAGTGTSVASPGSLPGCSTVLGNYYTNTAIEAVTNSNGTDWYDKVLVGGQNGVAPAPSGTCTQGADPKTNCNSTVGTLPDPVGSGALRFTNGAPYGYYENGAIISSTPFNTGQGLQVTFKTVTYRGNAGGAGADGADGIGFFLLDASKATPANGIGAIGGSLGYSCSNVNAPGDGIIGGYLGIGIDEFGNFMNGNNNMFTGTNPNPGYTILHGDNGASGWGYYPNRIGLRGAGSVSWAYLHANYGTYYPNSLTAAQRRYAVNWTCIKGQVLNFQTTPPGDPNNAATAAPAAVSPQPAPALLDYAPISYTTVPQTIAAETAWARPNAVPLQYNLKITQNGLLSLSYSYGGAPYAPVISAYNIASSNGTLPSSLYFGFAGSTGGSTNIHEILCFKAGPPEVSSSSASVNEKQTSEVQTTSQAYFSFYDPNDFTGRVVAYPLIDSAGVISVGSTANWDSECELTGLPAGQTCLTTGATGVVAAQSPAGRVMLTWNGVDTALLPGTAGIPFEWPSGGSAGITAAEQAILDAGDPTPPPYNGNRLNYLRGVRTNEINSSGVGLYRARDGVLADIVDSSPVWVGPPSSAFTLFWRDRFDTADSMLENTGTQSYAAYKIAEQGRLNVVYVGANDGFLHGFRTGSEDSQGNVVSNGTTPNDGAEVLAYMPGAVLNTIHTNTAPTTDYSNAQYQHNFYVDATPGTGDLFYQGAWHTWLVGGLGAGGAAIFALNITDPLNQPFAENNAAGIVMGEWSSATITCVGNAACGANLGNTYGTPLIRRFHNGTWGAIFGNGYGSATGDAGIYVMTVDQSAGSSTINFYYLSTATGTLVSPGNDGIAGVTSADLDGDHITDYVYAGDLKGKVWRFDLTSTNPASWAVTSGGPLFTTPGGQPITEPVIVASVYGASAGTPQIMIGFGTGQRTQFTNTSGATYVSGTQALYGIWDTNFAAWNLVSPATFLSLTGAPAPETIANLQQQTLSLNATTGLVTTSNTAVNWATSCASSCNGKLGWYANLGGTSGATNVAGASLTEQIVSPPGLYQSAFIVNSAIPANNSILSCSATTTDGGVTYALNLATGGTFASGSTAQSAFTAYKNTTTVGVLSNETGSLAVVNTKEGTTYLLGQLIAPTITSSTSNGVTTLNTNIAGTQQIGLPPNVKYSRQTWVELR